MKFCSVMAAVAASLVLAACGGGGSSGGSMGNGAVIPTPVIPNPIPSGSPASAPSAAPSASPTLLPSPMPTTTPAPTMPASTVTIKGAPGFISPNGFTLYVFGADTLNVSNCNAACAQIWPPFMAPANAQAVGGFTAITRADGTKQWAFNGHPLYNFTGDAKAGDANGDGLNLNGGIWHVARP
jgi:predicted lipoprotein with Yx(FWY)xxD motif